MARFTALKGSARRYLDNITGQEVSRRTYQEYMRAGMTNEQLASINRRENPLLAAARPAKGRKSILKLSQVERDLIAQARIEDKIRRSEIAAENKAQKEAEKLLAKRSNRKPIKRKKITGALLQPGRMGRRVPFDYYSDYLEMFAEAKRGGIVKFYGLGMQGHHENTGKELDITVFPMRTFTSPIPEDEFDDAMNEELESRAYFIFDNYWMHLAFDKGYAAKRASKKRTTKRGKNRGSK